MSAQEFWKGDVWLAEAYREAHKLKVQEQNNMAWLTGLYTYNAVAAIATKLTSKRKAEYMDKPIDLFPEEKEEDITKNHEAIFNLLEAMMLASGGKNVN